MDGYPMIPCFAHACCRHSIYKADRGRTGMLIHQKYNGNCCSILLTCKYISLLYMSLLICSKIDCLNMRVTQQSSNVYKKNRTRGMLIRSAKEYIPQDGRAFVYFIHIQDCFAFSKTFHKNKVK